MKMEKKKRCKGNQEYKEVQGNDVLDVDKNKYKNVNQEAVGIDI